MGVDPIPGAHRSHVGRHAAHSGAPGVTPPVPEMPCRPVEFPRPLRVELASAQREPESLLVLGRAQLAVFEPVEKAQSIEHPHDVGIDRNVGHGPRKANTEVANQDVHGHVGDLRANTVERQEPSGHRSADAPAGPAT